MLQIDVIRLTNAFQQRSVHGVYSKWKHSILLCDIGLFTVTVYR